jgi:cellulose synthase (UDP-forming)
MRRSYFDRRMALPYLLLLALNVAGLVMAERRYVADPAHRDTVIMNAAWTVYSTMILVVAASVAWERRKLRSGACLRANLPATMWLESGRGIEYDRPIDGATVLLSRNSVTVKVDAALELPRGAPLVLLLGDGKLPCYIQALVAHSAGHRQHLFLPDLTEKQEEHLEGLMHSRRKALAIIAKRTAQRSTATEPAADLPSGATRSGHCTDRTVHAIPGG